MNRKISNRKYRERAQEARALGLKKGQKRTSREKAAKTLLQDNREPEKGEMPAKTLLSNNGTGQHTEDLQNRSQIEGRNAVTEAFRSGREIDKLFLLEQSQDPVLMSIRKMAQEAGTPIKTLSRTRLDYMSETGAHQGVIAHIAAYKYAQLEDLFLLAQKKNEDPFFILLDNLEDPHNLGAIIRTANAVGAHGVIITKDRAVGLTATVAKASAGALNYTPVCRVTNLSQTIEELKERGLWFVCADMKGTPMTKCSLTGPIGLVIGSEGEGVSRLVKEKSDIIASIPLKGEIGSLNASVAMAVLSYEILRQRG